jgi:Helix-turn-helix domain
MLRISSEARLVTVQEAADLLRVDSTTINGWINKGLVPYIELPGTGERKSHRLPLNALLQSLSGNYDLQPHIDVVDKKVAATTANDDAADEIE